VRVCREEIRVHAPHDGADMPALLRPHASGCRACRPFDLGLAMTETVTETETASDWRGEGSLPLLGRSGLRLWAP